MDLSAYATSTEEQARLVAEARRIAAVKALDLVGGPPERVFDEAVYLAAVICGTPINLVTVLDGTVQHFKAKIGILSNETRQDQSFCVHAIQKPNDLFIVPDTLLDSRFRDNPLVTQAPNVRFYAGMPLTTPQGEAVGTLCVLDTVPRELTEQQKVALGMLSRHVASHFEDREKVIRLSQAILEKERIERDLRNSNALFETFMDHSPLIGFMKDDVGRLIYYNRAFAEHFRISRSAWIGKDEYDFFPSDVAARLREPDEALMRSEGLAVMEVKIPDPDGTEHFFRTYKFAFVNASGDRFLAGMSHEITEEMKTTAELERHHLELRLANEMLLELSITDPLTGCRNRRFFDERLAEAFSLAARHDLELSVLLLDIDDFKRVNDSFGHEKGDAVLRHVSSLLMLEARETDVVCRYGGEEFALLLPLTSQESAFQLADRMRASVEAGWDGCAVTVSIGVGTRLPGVLDASTLLRQADAALYQAKAEGKNRVVRAGI